MSEKSKAILKKYSDKFKSEVKKETQFFKKPASLTALIFAATAMLSVYGNTLKSKIISKSNIDPDDLSLLRRNIRTNSLSSAVMKYASNDLDDSIVSSLLLECQTGIPSDGPSDINEKLEKNKHLFQKYMKPVPNFTAVLGVYFLLYYFITETIKLLNDTEFPSIYRMKYLQKIGRMCAGLMKEIGGEFKDLIEPLNKIDAALIAIAVAAATYTANRIILQNRSKKFVEENTCEIVAEANPTVKKRPFAEALFCPPETDDVLVPKEPFEEKLKNLSCEVPSEQETVLNDATLKPDLATKAIIENQRDEKMVPTVKAGTVVTDQTVVAKLNKQNVYSPVNGTVSAVKTNEIRIENISENSQNFLSRSIADLNLKYKEYNDAKMFLKDYEVASLYPVMMKFSPELDPSANKTKAVYVGMDEKFDHAKKLWSKIVKDYEKNVKDITSEKNVKKHAENETTHLIKEQLDAEDALMFKNMNKIVTGAKNVAAVTIPKKSEYEMIEYYLFELSINLNGNDNPSDVEKSFRDQVNVFVETRYVIDGYRPKKIEQKINDLIDKLEKGITLGNWFAKGVAKYKERYKIEDVKSWLRSIADKNKKLEENEKTLLVQKITYLYQFYFNTDAIVNKYSDLKNANKKETLSREANYFSNYFDGLNKRITLLPKEIKDLEKQIEDLSLFTTYSLIEYEGEQYRNYTIANPKNVCDKSVIDKTETDFGSMKYWIKYCSFATLASVANPATSWATGIILPTGGLRLPTVYIPVKPITTSYGFALLGITITGLWVFPLVLFVNYSSNYSLPIADPTAALKKEIEALKNNLNGQLKKFKTSVLKDYLDKTLKQVQDVQSQLEMAIETLKVHKEYKPSKKLTKEYANWLETNLKMKENVSKLKVDKWKLEKKYKLVYQAYTTGSSTKSDEAVDKALASVQKLEDTINKQFDKLDALASRLEYTIASLPISLKPDTANFGMTLKNPKPVINIADNLDDNVNVPALEKVTKPFQLNNEDMMKKNYGNALDKSVINFKKYKSALNTAQLTIVSKDPFPAYEKLKVTNVQWLAFLYKDWAPTGAKTYGIPGGLPTPV